MDGIDTCLILIPLAIVISIIMFLAKRRKFTNIGFLISVLVSIYIIIIFDKTFFPLPVSARELGFHRSSYAGSPYYNFIPLNSIISMISNNVPFRLLIVQIGGNIALFIPLGFLIIWKLYRQNKKINLLKTIVLCALSSASIEIIQLIVSLSFGYPFRFSDIDDIILNTIGGTLGALCFMVVLPLTRILFAKLNKKSESI